MGSEKCVLLLTTWLACLRHICMMPTENQYFISSTKSVSPQASYSVASDAPNDLQGYAPPDANIGLWKSEGEFFEKHSEESTFDGEPSSVIFGVRRPRNKYESDLKYSWPFSYRLGFNANSQKFKTVRTEMMSSDGVIEGELLFLSPKGRERGVRYTAQPGIEPLLLYKSLLHFLKLTT